MAAYIDARMVQDRLDSVVGPLRWMDSYRELSDQSMLCTLSIYDPEAKCWISREGVGYAGDLPGEPLKAAESDALKRAAVKIGIGRYLYSLKVLAGVKLGEWVEVDEYGQPGRVKTPAKTAAEPSRMTKDQESRIDTLSLSLDLNEDSLNGRALLDFDKTNWRELNEVQADTWIGRLEKAVVKHG